MAVRGARFVWPTALLLPGLIGCAAHVDLTAPEASASSKERLEAWERLHAIQMKETHITYVRGGVTVGAEARTDYLQLADGRRVYHPEDLAPAVRPDSPTAAAVDAYGTQSAVAGWLTIGGIVVVAGGTGVALGGIASDSDSAEAPMLIGGVVAIGVGALALVVAQVFRGNANDEKSSAFVTYNDSLLKRLDLCTHAGNRVTPCQGAVEPGPNVGPLPAPAPPVPPPPVPPEAPPVAPEPPPVAPVPTPSDADPAAPPSSDGPEPVLE